MESGSPAPIVLTMGEPAGIGGEIALTAWRRRGEGGVPFALIDDPRRLVDLARTLGWAVPIHPITKPEQAFAVWPDALPVLPLHLAAPVIPGQPDAANSPFVIDAITQAVKLVQQGKAGALVTNPIHKHVLADAGFLYPGHTEFLAALAGGKQPVMMLACSGLRVVPVTVHCSLATAIGRLSIETIVSTARITAEGLKRDFGVETPRLAIAALNPHAGEGGLFGREEIEIITPAIEILRADGLHVTGPASADTLFHQAARQHYDVALCMYHDQALIPLKTIDFAGGVNVTLGLPFLRTSPDHGTAFDIAGSGTADPTSLMAALAMAAEGAEARRNHTA